MSFAPTRLNALLGSFVVSAVFLTALFPIQNAEAKIKGVAQEACDIGEEEFKTKLVEDVVSAGVLCGEGITPQHTGGFTCSKVSLKDCKQTRIRCVTQFICASEPTEPKVVLLSTPKPIEKSVEPEKEPATKQAVEVHSNAPKAMTPPPSGKPLNETKSGAIQVAASPEPVQSAPKAVPQTPQSTSNTSVATIPPQAPAQPGAVSAPKPPAPGSPVPAASVPPMPTTIPPPALKTLAPSAMPAASSSPQSSAPSTKPEMKVEKLGKPVDIQQIDLDSFNGGSKPPGLPDLAALGSGVLIGILAIFLFFFAAMWRLFEKAGHSGLKAIIPIYNMYTLHRVAGQPGWWILIDLIPLVGFISACLMNKKIAEKFSASQGIMVLMILMPPIGYAIVAFSPKYKYNNGAGNASAPPAEAAWQKIEMVAPEDKNKSE